MNRFLGLASDALTDFTVHLGKQWPFLQSNFPTFLRNAEPSFMRRIIWGRDGKTPYLGRFYINAEPLMPDGSNPWDANGNLRPGYVIPEGVLPHVHVHHFYRSDDDGELHNHPWKWALSIVLAGGYSEERRTKDDHVERRLVKPFSINFITENTFHRVDLLDEKNGAWSIFIAGPRTQSWGFWNRVTKKFTSWEKFLKTDKIEVHRNG